MAIQHFWTAASAIQFPEGVRPVQLRFSYLQLRKLFWHEPAKRLVAAWVHTATEFNLTGQFGFLWRMAFLRRDGQQMDLFDIPMNVLIANTLELVVTTDGRVLRGADDATNQANVEFNAAVGDALFPISTRWANDILTNEQVISASVINTAPQASVVFAGGNAWVLKQAATGNTDFTINAQPGSTQIASGTGLTFRHARDLLFIDSKRAAVTFMQHSTVGPDTTIPSRIRVYDTTSTPWSLLWTDFLPVNDTRACFDQVNDILYSCNQNPGAVMHASQLRQMPASLSVLTLVSGSTLTQRTATKVSVLTTGSFDNPISGAVVRWTLASQVSGGALDSAYSTTNDSGVATITYVGPDGVAGGTETITAEVAEIWPKGLI